LEGVGTQKVQAHNALATAAKQGEITAKSKQSTDIRDMTRETLTQATRNGSLKSAMANREEKLANKEQEHAEAKPIQAEEAPLATAAKQSEYRPGTPQKAPTPRLQESLNASEDVDMLKVQVRDEIAAAAAQGSLAPALERMQQGRPASQTGTQQTQPAPKKGPHMEELRGLARKELSQASKDGRLKTTIAEKKMDKP